MEDDDPRHTTEAGDDEVLAALEEMEKVINELNIAGREFSISLHQKHVALATQAGLDDQVEAARTMMVQSVTCGDDVWIPLLDSKTATADVTSSSDLADLLQLHEQSVEGYLSIPLLTRRAEFVLRHWARLQEAEEDEDLKDMLEDVAELFTEAKVREVLLDTAARASAHISQSHKVWDLVKDWELSILEKLSAEEITDRLPKLHTFFLTRLRSPHSTLDATFQFYASLVSTFCPAEEYESLLVMGTKAKAVGFAVWSKRETWEDQIATPGADLPSLYQAYIAWELKPKKPDAHLVQNLYARAIAEQAAKGPYEAEPFWVSLITFLNSSVKNERIILENVFKAVRSVPGSGEIWAAYMRGLEEFVKPAEEVDGIYRSALGSGLLHARGPEDAVKVVMARISYERRRVEASEVNDESFIELFLEGIQFVNDGVKGGDPAFMLEKYLISWFERTQRLTEASSIWESLSSSHASSYLVWLGWSGFETRRPALPKAREVYKAALGHAQSLDWPEAVCEAYLSFEEMYGSLEESESAKERARRTMDGVNFKRHKDAVAAAKKAQYEEADVGYQEPSAQGMDVDVPAPVAEEGGRKRKAEEEEGGEAKKARAVEPVVEAAPLARDRENSTVFVSKLPVGTTQDDLAVLFKDCGEIREVKLTDRVGQVVASVEFMTRDIVPAALTKDKKKINDVEIEVSVAWQSTLYVTNFPEHSDDASIRELFGQYGTIFETRWPGKKFKGTRRFVYVQFLSPSSATAALELNGRELEPGHALLVAISDPARKQQRSDAKASEKEVVVTQMSKFVKKDDLVKLFKPYGIIKDIRMTLDADGNTRGAAFVEFEEESSAKAALALNSFELKKRRIAVTLPDSRGHNGGGPKKLNPEQSIRVGNLPEGTQEALLQQAFEKITKVLRVSVTERSHEGLVELENPDAVGLVLLSHNPFSFNSQLLPLLPATQRFPPPNRNAAASSSTSSSQAPEPAFFRPPPRPKSNKARLGANERKAPVFTPATKGDGDVEMGAASSKPKGQDAFRAMLNEKKG
ncbi:hypothetical protein BDY24DRAFT_439291 [Mrakia frigida]|uniref:uncharacterized protein n=1 Tax=Mrakia frigida TaxID=29902 RepID=UPI003FCC1E9C